MHLLIRCALTLACVMICGTVSLGQTGGFDFINKVALFSLLPFVLAFTFFFFVFYRYKRELELQRQKLDLEIRALRAQMNPHFIFNSLNSIYLYIQNNEPARAGGYLLQFSNLMRSVLENSMHELVTLEDDMEVLRNYLELEQMRTGHKFDFEINTALTDSGQLLVPPLILQPVVENAIWHGVMSRHDRGLITISIAKAGGNLSLAVEDNGTNEVKHDKQIAGSRKKKSLGTQITRERLQALSRKERAAATMHSEQLTDANGHHSGYRVSMLLPLIND
ncbi:MAG: sensor histidine kinase [Flavobacteriales bacterium]